MEGTLIGLMGLHPQCKSSNAASAARCNEVIKEPLWADDFREGMLIFSEFERLGYHSKKCSGLLQPENSTSSL